ncbi:DUF1566 domain-containing protein [Pseudomonas batumici]|uniref:DUF1566 domain-containing protein n=1 Tax=Pseudomonas batumici TaxID=226910 RepID=UPI0030D36FAF
MQLITVSRGETQLTTPDAALALQVLAGLSASSTPISPSSVPAVGAPWPGEGGINGGLFPGNGKPYYLIVPIGTDAEKPLEWGGYGDELEGADSAWDGQSNTAALVADDSDHPAAQFCHAFERDGHADFYLMSRREAAFLEITLADVFSKAWHWTSTQRSANNAFSLLFDGGIQYSFVKNHELRVRPVRRRFI